MKLEDKDGYPWTASIGLGWIVCIIALTSGIVFFALSFYLAFWIHKRSRANKPILFLTIAVAGAALSGALDVWHTVHPLSVGISIVGAGSLIAFPFILRHEIIGYYRRTTAWDIEIDWLWTLFFSTVYINYCLNPALAIVLPEPASPVTSLNLSPNPAAIHQSAK